MYKLVLVNFEGAFPESPSPVSTNDPAIIVSQCDVRRHNDVIEKTTAIVGSRLASEVSRFYYSLCGVVLTYQVESDVTLSK